MRTYCLTIRARIASREIVPTSRVFLSFTSAQGRTSPSSRFAFALGSSNEEGPALCDQTGMISHEVAMFCLPSACMTIVILCLSGGQPRAEERDIFPRTAAPLSRTLSAITHLHLTERHAENPSLSVANRSRPMAGGVDPESNTPFSFRKMLRQHILAALA